MLSVTLIEIVIVAEKDLISQGRSALSILVLFSVRVYVPTAMTPSQVKMTRIVVKEIEVRGKRQKPGEFSPSVFLLYSCCCCCRAAS